jgi:hypothetical protein
MINNPRGKVYDSEVEARTDEWHKRRWARFTASEMYKLFSPVKGNAMFGDGAITYIKQKALEMTTTMQERPEIEEAKSILHGRAHEYSAFKEYVRITGNTSITYLGDDNPMFYPYRPLAEESGGTPDSANITSAGLIDFGAEIKCPKNSMYHFDRLKWKTQWDVKENYILAYTQCQFLMMCTGAKKWDFMSFDDRQLVRAYKSKIIEIKQDVNFQNNLEVRLRQAIKEKYRIISEHYGVVVTNRTEFIQKFNLAA